MMNTQDALEIKALFMINAKLALAQKFAEEVEVSDDTAGQIAFQLEDERLFIQALFDKNIIFDKEKGFIFADDTNTSGTNTNIQ